MAFVSCCFECAKQNFWKNNGLDTSDKESRTKTSRTIVTVPLAVGRFLLCVPLLKEDFLRCETINAIIFVVLQLVLTK